jgi:hypothetical protein
MDCAYQVKAQTITHSETGGALVGGGEFQRKDAGVMWWDGTPAAYEVRNANTKAMREPTLRGRPRPRGLACAERAVRTYPLYCTSGDSEDAFY